LYFLDFIDREDEGVPDTDEFLASDARARRELNRRFVEHSDAQLAELAADIDRRYKKTSVRRYRGDSSAHKSQQSLLPSVRDPKLWMVRCREGKERDAVFLLMRKFLDLQRQESSSPLKLHSAFFRNDLKGFIYVEADMAAHVSEALQQVPGVYISRLTLVPVREMTDVLTIRKEERSVDLLQREWVRIKRGKYMGDLARVMDVSESGDVCTVRLIPRLDLTTLDRRSINNVADKKRKSAMEKGKAGIVRPPQKLFNPRDLPTNIARQLSRNQRGYYLLGSDTFKDGYLEKSVKVSALNLEGAPPTLDEINKFANSEGVIDSLTLQNLKQAIASREAENTAFHPGDNVKVISGELSSIPAVVLSVLGTTATILPQLAGVSEKTTVPIAQLRKRFVAGDMVRIINGKYRNQVGTVVNVSGNNATVISATDLEEIHVFIRDLQDAKDAIVVNKGDPLVHNSAISGGDQHSSSSRSRGGMPRSRPMGGRGGMPPKDQLLGLTVKILGGPYKGYMGIVKQIGQDGLVNVELHTNCRTVSVDKNKLSVRDESGVFHGPSSMHGSSRTGSNSSGFKQPSGSFTPGSWASPHGNGGSTRSVQSVAHTPNPYASAQTPNPYASAQTPNPYSSSSFASDGGRTPAWDAGSRTPYQVSKPFDAWSSDLPSTNSDKTKDRSSPTLHRRGSISDKSAFGAGGSITEDNVSKSSAPPSQPAGTAHLFLHSVTFHPSESL
jgi:transcription elongation factor